MPEHQSAGSESRVKRLSLGASPPPTSYAFLFGSKKVSGKRAAHSSGVNAPLPLTPSVLGSHNTGPKGPPRHTGARLPGKQGRHQKGRVALKLRNDPRHSRRRFTAKRPGTVMTAPPRLTPRRLTENLFLMKPNQHTWASSRH